MLLAKNFVPLGERQLMEYFGGPVIFGVNIANPCRKDSSDTSSSFLQTNTGGVVIMDYARATLHNWRDVARMKLGTDNLGVRKHVQKHYDEISQYSNAIVVPSRKEFDFVFKPFSKEELDWWKAQGIEQDTLQKFNVRSVKTVYIDCQVAYKSTSINPIYLYKYSSGSIKLYRPFAPKKNKWVSTTSVQDVAGLPQLQPGRLLIITKSHKDVMFLSSLGLNAISFQGESVGVGKNEEPYIKTLISYLKTKYKYIVWLYDNDETGLKAAIKLSSLYGGNYLLLPEKDATDTYKKYKKKTWKILKRRLAQCLRH